MLSGVEGFLCAVYVLVHRLCIPGVAQGLGLVEEPREPSLRGVRRGGRRGNLNSLGDIQYEIAALPAVARNDNQRDFINTPERPGHPPQLSMLIFSTGPNLWATLVTCSGHQARRTRTYGEDTTKSCW